MRAWPVALLLLLAGCAAPPAGPPAAEPAPEAPAPSGALPGDAPADGAGGEASLPAAAPPAPPRFAEAGAAWDGCRIHAATLAHKHEFAEPFLPPEYAQVNTLAGGVGQSAILVATCEALFVGDQTALGPVSLSYFGVHVRPPREADGEGFHVYLLDLATTSAGLAAQLQEAGLPAAKSAIALGEADWSIDSDAFDATGSEPRQTHSTMNLTSTGRLHWKSGDAPCWTTITLTTEKLLDTSVLVASTKGHPFGISGGTGRLTGLGNVQAGAGSLAAPECAA